MNGQQLYEKFCELADEFKLWSFLTADERRVWEDLADHVEATMLYHDLHEMAR